MLILAELPGLGAVGLCNPEILAAGAIADEGNHAAVGRIDRLAVEGKPGGNGFGLPAGDRHSVKIAQEIEQDGPAITRDVERKPGAFIGGEVELSLGFQRQAGLSAGTVLREDINND